MVHNGLVFRATLPVLYLFSTFHSTFFRTFLVLFLVLFFHFLEPVPLLLLAEMVHNGLVFSATLPVLNSAHIHVSHAL